MKQSLLTVLLFFYLQGMAQVPQQINYQGVARNSVGSVIANQSISLRLSIREGSASGNVVYRETRNLKTNNFGLFVTAIGSAGAANVFGTFSNINWGSGVKYLQVEIDPAGATAYLDMGTSQLLSVPYSFYAGAAPPVGTAAGDLQGNFPAPQIRDGAVTTTKIADGSITATKLEAGLIPSSLPPGGNAAGDLTGNYPAPSIANGVVNNSKIADDAIGTSKIQDASVTASKLAPGVIPTALPPTGTASGDLAGTYPNPTINAGAVNTGKIADDAVVTSKIADGSVTAAKLAPGVVPTIPTTLPPSGTASGDLTGTYPNPTINVGAVNTSKIADGSVTASKLAPGVIPTSLPPSGTASGDLIGTYPNPTVNAGAIDNGKLADNAVTTNKVVDGSITAAKLAPGVIPTSIPVSGAAGGDLVGTFPNPTVNAGAIDNSKLADNAVTTNKVVDGSITAAKLAPGVIPTSIPVSGTAGGDLVGTFPNPTVNAGAIDNSKLADNAVTTNKVVDGSITAAKLAPGVIPTSIPVSGTAGGDLVGTFPNPTINASAVDNSKIADNAISTNKVIDGSITAAKLAPGVIPTSIPVSGTAGGDLVGTFPNPTINAGAVDNGKIADNAVTTNKVADGSITTAKLAPGVIPTIPTTLPPSGAASGDLTGTYPNPTINANAVDNGKIADNAVSTNKVIDGSITAAKLAPGVIPTIPTTLPPSGSAGGDLTGTYPNPAIGNGVVTTTKLADGAVTNTKIADNSISTAKVQDGSITAAKLDPSLLITGGGGSPTGSAGGDLQGNYPNPNLASGSVTSPKISNGAVITPKIADGAVNSNKLADNSVSSAKIIDGTITAADLDPSLLLSGGGGSPTGAAGGDLAGTYPNPTVAANAINTTKIVDNAVTTTKLADGNVTAAKLAPGVIPTIPTTLPPSGGAGGDLTGTYPNPTVAAGAITNSKIADNAITTSKVADNTITSSKIVDGTITAADLDPSLLLGGGGGSPTGAAGGDLAGTYPNPTVAANAITSTKIADNSIVTNKIADGNVTAAKLAPGVIPTIPTTLPPSGAAGGDLTGTYPNPTIATDAITTNKIADGNVTAAKLAPGVIPTIPTALPPNGTASGDLSGTYPAPSVAKIKGIGVSNTAPTTGQVLKYDGTQWTPSADNAGGFSLPFAQTINSATAAIAITNQGVAPALQGDNTSNIGSAIGITGRITNTNAGIDATAVKGVNNSVNANGYGVWGHHAGSGSGVYGFATSGNGISGKSQTGTGVFGTSTDGTAGYFDIANASNAYDALFASTNGYGNGLVAIGTYNNGVLGIANDVGGAGVLGANNAGGEGIVGRTFSNVAGGVVGRNDGTYAGVKGMNTADGGVGVLALANANGAINGTALVASLEGTAAGNTAVFKANGLNVARIDKNGKGFFNGGTQVGGADLAEYFDVEGQINAYEPGDVLMISTSADRKVEKSSGAYSTLVAGVYATKPGLMLTELNAEQDELDKMVPMGVIGVIPTKVCTEGGAIKRGDLIVTSSITGVAMKADPDKVKVGQVIGKALEDYSGNGIGKIKILVSIK